ncbi:Card1-like endonuclease domain-containing protein [Cellulomonas humilata]|uniref:Card1 endonuclease domain-containing protein n=1 Tax=Cellulomonas humilata TaxID=144055 RepID=A0ABU0EL21_9CELL|nr:DUF1887 family CARF protein [Cellulomonas humilata]MDQ0375987.1 hypothetical protein [Cellulomonas humilata]
MRELLLTWYGITDLRASLGFDAGEGPIVGALKSHLYTGVVVLGYVKRADGTSDPTAERDTFALELQAARDSIEAGDRGAASRFVTQFANSQAAHMHFETWLRARVDGLSPGTEVTLTGHVLNGLNDTEGIYAGAVQALDAVAQHPEPTQVSLYLSPGTPAMAFTWAFAALAHPGVRKRLIASSDPTRPPELVRLPAEWMERFGRPARPNSENGAGFDAVFHLFGEQRMPALLGVRQFEAAHHIFVSSEQFPATVMRQFTGGAATSDVHIDPYDPADVRDRILAHAADLGPGKHLGFNLTGGTKLMYAGALAAARALGATPFYFDSRNRRVVFLDGFDSQPIKPIDSVQTFFDLNGDGLSISRKGGPPNPSSDRAALTEALWKQRSALATMGFYKRISAYNDDSRPFKDASGGFTFELKDDRTATVSGNGLDLAIPNWPRFAAYLSGGWFEEYVYAQLKPYADNRAVQDLRINLELAIASPAGNYAHRGAFNELDVVFTDGYSLYIVECKAGMVNQEQVMKLQNLVRYYGGVDGRGIVAAHVPPSAIQVRRKIEDAHIVLCSGSTLVDQLKEFVDGIAARTAVGE